MHRPWYRRLMDRLRAIGWWPIHYKPQYGKGGSWWSWRGKHYFYRPGGSNDA